MLIGGNVLQNTLKAIILILISIFFVILTSFTAAAFTYNLYAEAPKNVNVGRSFDIKLSADKDQFNDICALKIIAEFNSDSFSVKDICCNGGEAEYSNENGKLTVICLFNNGVEDKKDFLTFSFTAKTGQNSSSQTINFSCTEAVDTNLNNVDVTVKNNVLIDINKSSSASSKTSENTKNSSFKISDKISSKSASSSKSKKNTGSSKSENKNSNAPHSTNSASEAENGESQADDTNLPEVGYLSDNNNTTNYVIAGIGIGVSVAAVIFISYKIGNKNKSGDKFKE